MFKRKIESVINTYLTNPSDKILIIDGAKQVGKTFIISKLAREHFPNYVEINLKDDIEGDRNFDVDKANTEEKFYLRVSSLYGEFLNNKNDTIIFLDEIQVYPHLLTLLKALKKDDRYTYIVSGSLLGVTLKHTFIPMGSIVEEKMYPLDFEEFLWANHVGESLIANAKKCFDNYEQIDNGVHEFLLNKFKEYLLCGGFPDAVKEYVINKNIAKMRKIHQQIYDYYKDDCSQYDSEHKLKIERIYEMMPSYMENKIKRIQASKIRNNKMDTLAKYEDEFDYLIASSVAISVKAIANPKSPLIESSSKNLIKLYYNDVGLLTNILYKNNIDAVLNVDKGINLGSAYETAVAIELNAHGHKMFYFDSKKVGEVDFLVNDYDNLTVLPIEVKSGRNDIHFRAIPKLIDDKGNFKLSKGIILSNKSVIKKDGNLTYLPVYMAMFI